MDDPVNVVGQYTSIAIGADGLPVISHRDVTSQNLRVTHCGNAACTAGNVSTTIVDPLFPGQYGGYSSIAIGIDGLPIIGHSSQSNASLRFTHCGNPACTAGNVSTAVFNDGEPGGSSFISMAIGRGLPIATRQAAFGVGALHVTHCGNVTCTSRSYVRTVVDRSPNGVGGHASIAIGADGLPVISHQEEGANALRVTKCATATCR